MIRATQKSGNKTGGTGISIKDEKGIVMARKTSEILYPGTLLTHSAVFSQEVAMAHLHIVKVVFLISSENDYSC